LHATYAAEVLGWLCRSFGSVALVAIQERLFVEAQEQTIVLLASERGGASDQILYGNASTVTDAIHETSTGLVKSERRTESWQRSVVDAKALALFDRLVTDESVASFRSIFDVRIGVVTGANDFFTRAASDNGVAHTVPLVKTSKWLKSSIWSTADQRRVEASGAQARLLTLRASRAIPTPLRRDVAAAEVAKIALRTHCAKRLRWWALDDYAVPDVFLPYMGTVPPRLVMNQAKSTCLNSVHRLTWRTTRSRSGFVASSWTSLFGLACELHGRRYGGGVLKIEPGGAHGLPLVRKVPAPLLKEIDKTVRSQGRPNAIAFADKVILGDMLGLSNREIALLRTAAQRLAAIRRCESVN
jgi:hypothetical protein